MNLPTTPVKPWNNVSASQINTYRSCPTKWWWEKRGGFPQPETEAMRRGKRLHKAWENYLLFGAVPQDPIAISTLEHLPPPGSMTKEHVERRIDQTEGLPVPLIGYIDLEEPPHIIARVTDHKTTSDFKWCKTPEELSLDPQALIYAEAYFRKYPHVPSVIFRHVYGRTKGRAESTTREVELSRQWVAEQYQRNIVGTAHEMAADAVKDVREVAYKTSACDRYGGCPHRARCMMVGKQLGGMLQGLFGGDSMDQTTQALGNLFGGGASAPQPATTPAAPQEPATRAPLLPEQEPQVYVEFDSVHAGVLPDGGFTPANFASTQVQQAEPLENVPVFFGHAGSMILGDSQAFLDSNGVLTTSLGNSGIPAILEGRCKRAFYGSCASSPTQGALYIIFGEPGEPSTVALGAQSAAPAGPSLNDEPAPTLPPSTNPPDGVPANKEVSAAEAANKPRNKSKGPYLKDNTRVRGLSAAQAGVQYKTELTERLTPEELSAWKARTTPEMLAWFEAGCPDKGKLKVRKKDIVEDCIMLEELIEAMGKGAELPPAAQPAAPTRPVVPYEPTNIGGLSLGFGSVVEAQHAQPGMYRSTQGYLVELTGERDEQGFPRAVFFADEWKDIALVMDQALVPTNETWELHGGLVRTVDDIIAEVNAASGNEPGAPEEVPIAAQGSPVIPPGTTVPLTSDGVEVGSATMRDDGTMRGAVSTETPQGQAVVDAMGEGQKLGMSVGGQTAPDGAIDPAKATAVPVDPHPQAGVETGRFSASEPNTQVAKPRGMTGGSGHTPNTLFIGCYPVRSDEEEYPVEQAHEWLRQFAVEVEQANGVPHYLLLEYSKGIRQMVTLAVQRVTALQAQLPVRMVIDPRLPSGDFLVEALTPFYPNVVRRLG